MTRSVTNVDFLNDLGTVNAQTGTTYTVVSGDRGKLITFTNASAIAVTQPQAGSTFPNGWFVDFQNRGVGTVTITPTTSSVDGAASIALTTGQGIRLFSDGTNYFTQRGLSSAALTVKDEGSTLTTATSSVDFVGAGVTATNTGGSVTVTIPGGSSDFLAALISSEVAVTGAVTLDGTAFGKMHKCSGTTADYTITLPASSGNTGKFIGFRMENGLTKLVTLDGNASETIDGSTTRIMWKNETAILMCDGSGWIKIGGKSIPMHAIMRRAAAQSLTTGVNNVVAMDTVVTDNTGFIANTTSGRVDIKRPGAYVCSGAVSVEGMNSGNEFQGGVGLNNAGGGANPNASVSVPSPAAGFGFTSGTGAFSCATGDTILTWAFHNSGISLNTRTIMSVQPTLSVTEIPSW